MYNFNNYNFNDYNMNINNTVNNLDYKKIGSLFCEKYYNEISKYGIHSVLYLFNEKTKCIINNNKIIGGYNWLLFLTNNKIKKFYYKNLKYIIQELDHNNIILYVNGMINCENLWNEYLEWKKFNEIFILNKNSSNKYQIKNYILYII